jgi:pyruvate/2-oxoacid:ferredoxin oxidoreductase alpha subunit
VKAGMFRPITLWPFPSQALAKAASKVKNVLVVEMSNGQMVEDVRLALNGEVPVKFYGRVGGNVPSVPELQEIVTSFTSAATPPSIRPARYRTTELTVEATEEKSVDPFSMVI